MTDNLSAILHDLECAYPGKPISQEEIPKKDENVNWKYLLDRGYINDIVNPKNNSDYILTDYLGAGSFGAVFRAYNATLGLYFAIKLINLVDGNYTDFTYEIEAYYYLSRTPSCQTHIVCLYEAFIIPDINVLYQVPTDYNYAVGVLVCELMDGDLTTIKVPPTNMPLLIRDLVDGLDFIHRNGFCHRDIKPSNVLVKSSVYKLGDLGLSCHDDTTLTNDGHIDGITNGCSYLGTPMYLAPEAIKYWNREVSLEDCQRNDIWMLGVTLYMIIFNNYPFPVVKDDKSYSFITSLKQNEINSQLQSQIPPKTDTQDLEGPQIMTLLEAMLQVNPENRVSASDLKTHLETIARSSRESYIPVKLQESINCTSDQARRNVRILLQEVELASLDLIKNNRFHYIEHIRNIETLLHNPDTRCLDIPYLENIYQIYHDDVVTRKNLGNPDNLVILGDVILQEIQHIPK